jgi:hypothetical protein
MAMRPYASPQHTWGVKSVGARRRLAPASRRVEIRYRRIRVSHTDLPKIHDPVILFVPLAHITCLAKRSGSVSWAVAWLPGGGLFSSGHYEGEK